MFCGSCGAQIKEGAKFCPHCGQVVLAETPVQTELSGEDKKETAEESCCKYCGALLKEGALFCGNCGGKTEENTFSGSQPPEDKTAPPEPEEPEVHDEAAALVEPKSEAGPGALNIPAQAEDGGYLKTISGKNAEIARLNADMERLAAERNQISDENRKLKESFKKTKPGLIAAIIIGALGIIIAIVVGYNNYDTMKSFRNTYDSLKASYDSLYMSHIRSMAIWQIRIASMKAGNWRNNGWITEPGGVLNASDVYRLGIIAQYSADINKTVSFNIKWYYPGNNLQRWSNDAPSGYTVSINQTISSNGGQFDLGYWGWDEPGKFPRGTHTIELWYEGFRLNTLHLELK
jgi:uncharacterized Zn finger protein (UPF0148 family)